MTPYHLGNKSLRVLRGGHPHLVACVMLAIKITEQDFTVKECGRTLERQKQLVNSGRSWTMASDHIYRLSTEPHPVAHAVDLYAYDPNNQNAWKDFDRQFLIFQAMEHAAEQLDITGLYSGWREWGKDIYHFGLRGGVYKRAPKP